MAQIERDRLDLGRPDLSLPGVGGLDVRHRCAMRKATTPLPVRRRGR